MSIIPINIDITTNISTSIVTTSCIFIIVIIINILNI